MRNFKQKIIGFLMLLIGIGMFLILRNSGIDATAVVLIVPMGFFLMFTRENVFA